jgi:SWIM zinc finger
MPQSLTRELVLQLAPDAGSAKSGQDLAQARKWDMLGGDLEVIWGQCQGSGAKPYQVQVALSEPAFKCSCPSRKFPCKHGLGLLLIYAESPAALAPAERPAWVSGWLASRQARAAKTEKRGREAEPISDPEAHGERRAKRIERTLAGMRELGTWTRDLIRSGIGAVPGKGFQFFDRQARRLVDAQAPGIARLVRQLGSLAASGAGWQQPFLEHLAILHLATRALERTDTLPAAAHADVQAMLGITVAAAELESLAGVRDRWQLIAQETEFEDRLRWQSTWLFGIGTRRMARVLQFAHATAPFATTLLPGTTFEGELVFFPGNGPRAALRGERSAAVPLAEWQGFETLEAALDAYSSALGACPWPTAFASHSCA